MSAEQTGKDNVPATAAAVELTERQREEEQVWLVMKRRIVDLAYRNRMSLKQVSELAELPEGAVRDVVAGKSLNPRVGTLVRIARALGVQPAQLLPAGDDSGEAVATPTGVAGVEVHQVPLLERQKAPPGRPPRHVVVCLPPVLHAAAQARTLVGWQVDSEPQAAGLQVGDLVIADVTHKAGGDNAPYLVQLGGCHRVVRLAPALKAGVRLVTVDGLPPETVPGREVNVLGRVVYLARARIG